MRTTTTAAAVLATVLLAAAPAAAADVTPVDDLAEGEAGHFVDVRFDSCAGLTGPVKVLLNGEATGGKQYALDAVRGAASGAKTSFLVHAGRYSVTAYDEGSSRMLGVRDVRADEGGKTSVRLSKLCAQTARAAAPATPTAAPPSPTSTTATKALPRVPTRIDTGLGPVEAQDPSALPAVALVAGTAVTGGALVLRGAGLVRRRGARP